MHVLVHNRKICVRGYLNKPSDSRMKHEPHWSAGRTFETYIWEVIFPNRFDVFFFFYREMTLKKVNKFLLSTHPSRIYSYNNNLWSPPVFPFQRKKILLTTSLRNVEANNVEHFCHQRTFDMPAGHLKNSWNFSRFEQWRCKCNSCVMLEHSNFLLAKMTDR